LCESNSQEDCQEATTKAFQLYDHEKGSLKAALEILTKLRGVGPATASLLLAIHQPDEVPFFSDELFLWLCHDGQSHNIKYTTKEYLALYAEAAKVSKRLRVGARELEKVAYVLTNRATTIEELETLAKPEEGSRLLSSQDVSKTKTSHSLCGTDECIPGPTAQVAKQPIMQEELSASDTVVQQGNSKKRKFTESSSEHNERRVSSRRR
jgi:hypothetical protein